MGQKRGGMKPSWNSGPLDAPSPPLPGLGVDRSTPLGMGQLARDGEVGGGGLTNLYLREKGHHLIGRKRETPSYLAVLLNKTDSGPKSSGILNFSN